MSDNLPEKKRGRPPKPIVKTTRKDMADNAKFWLSLQTLATNPLTKKKELLSNLDRLNIKVMQKALAGNVNAYNALMDRAFGKPKQYTEATINQRVTIAAFAWADDKLPDGAVPIPEPEGEEVSYEEVELPDTEVDQFNEETESAE
mgnify:CR=1 FL=1